MEGMSKYNYISAIRNTRSSSENDKNSVRKLYAIRRSSTSLSAYYNSLYKR